MSPVTFPQITVVGARGRDLEHHLVSSGMRVSSVSAADLPALAHPTARPAQVVLVDLRDMSSLPSAIALLRRHHPDTSVVLVVSALDPTLMLEAMRAGVTEIIPEPLSQQALEAAIGRVWQAAEPDAAGQVIAVVGAKGGVGATTIAVNMATILAREAPGEALLIDLHPAQGDAAVLLGVEPRFSVVDALENTHRLDEAFFRGLVVEVKKGTSLLASSERHVIGSPAADRVRALLGFAATSYKYVVVDVPRTDLSILDGLDGTQQVIVIVNQELSAIRNATRLVEALAQRYGKDRLVLALARFDKTAEIGADDIAKVVGLPVTYAIPNDYRSAVRAVNQGQPLVLGEQSKLAAALKTMTVTLAGLRTTPVEVPAPSGLLGRLALRRTS
jgi:pilus assembly protein CpaE